ncbi:MAG: hypothetical protein EB027_07350, partial [Actinobacteria bacterium]|nr:hypothetical protein [Actinomycetota bacterium]
TLAITATDPAGNIGSPTSLPIRIDTTPPQAPSAVLDPSSDSGTTGDRKTNDTTPTLSGTGTAGDTITIKDAQGNTLATATVQPDGTWSATPSTPLPEGLNTLAITATDPAGNTGSATSLPITIDTTGPAAPTVTAQITRDTSPVITGTAVLAAGETLSVTVNGATYTVVPAAGGAWSLDLETATPASGTLATLTDGVIPVTATARDAAGNTTSDTTPRYAAAGHAHRHGPNHERYDAGYYRNRGPCCRRDAPGRCQWCKLRGHTSSGWQLDARSANGCAGERHAGYLCE